MINSLPVEGSPGPFLKELKEDRLMKLIKKKTIRLTRQVKASG